MRLSWALLLLVVAVVVVAIQSADYDDQDHESLLENVDSLLRNRSFMKAQIQCVRNHGKCDRVGGRIKGIVKELQEKRRCLSCNPQERGQMRKVINYVKIHYTDFWEELSIDDEALRDLD